MKYVLILGDGMADRPIPELSGKTHLEYAKTPMLDELAKEFPQYGWEHNAGYLTKEHLDAIDKYGLCKYHRPSFLKKHFEKQLSLF